MKKIVILGSTGSIGTQTLDVAREQGDIKIVALAAGSNIVLLEKQIREFKPRFAAVWDEEKAKELKMAVQDCDVEIGSGMDGLIHAASMEEAEVVVTAVVGMIGIRPTIAAIEAGKNIALANKETLVTAGHIIMDLAKKNHVSILPVDSEHSAIFQSVNGEPKESVEKILLTASGGPFRTWTKEAMKQVRPADALKHPNWEMGRKITIDSATMVNKGLEVIEAKWLFHTDLDRIQVVVHPQSVIHSMVQYQDGAIMAQLGTPDMKLPIQYALYYPERRPMAGERLDLFKLGTMTFEEPDLDRFEGLKLAFEAAKIGGSMPVVYNAANEMAVQRFLDEKITFLQIPEIIGCCMEEHKVIANPCLEQILDAEAATYEFIESRW